VRVHFRAGDHVFVDESKARGYILAATAVSQIAIRQAEKALRGLLKPGQRRLHFTRESDSRRRLIVSRMVELEVAVSVWVAKNRADKEARPLLLEALAAEAARALASRITIESDASLDSADRRIIAGVVRREGVSLTYRHAAPHEEPVLWVSDAIAWCYSRGGDWTRRVGPLVEDRVITF